MFRKGGRSLIVILAIGIAIFVFVSMFFASLANTQSVVVAKVPLSAGTRLTAELLEVKQVNASDAEAGAFTTIDDVKGQLLVSARMPGDQITQQMVGDKAISAVAASLPAGQVAIAVKVTQDTGLAGIVRVGDKVGAVGIVSAQDLGIQQSAFNSTAAFMATPTANGVVAAPGLAHATPTPSTPNGATARIVLHNLPVLVVPQSFRYEETAPAGASTDTFTTARTTASQQQNSVIVIAAPVAPTEIAPGYAVSPVELLALLNAKGTLHFFLEPTAQGAPQPTGGIDPQDLLDKFFTTK